MNFHERLKAETKAMHDKSESHEFYKLLLDGKLEDQKYFVFLHNMFPIFGYLERRMDLTGELVRSPLIHTDIMRYAKSGSRISGEDLFYFDWICEIGQKADRFLPAILYVEWLKDVYGGQIIADKVKFSSTLKYNDVKKTIEKIRSLIVVEPEDEDQFIKEVNLVYENHIKLLDKIMEIK
jgi:hypothetical protein